MAVRKQQFVEIIKDHLAIATGVTVLVSAILGWAGSWALSQREIGKQSAEISQLQAEVSDLKKPVNQNPTLEQCVNLSKAQAVAVDQMQLVKADQYRELMSDLGCQHVNTGL